MGAAEEAELRAERLLAAHLTPAQRAQYDRTGRISIVKHGVVWRILLRQLASFLPLAPLLAVAAWHPAGLVLVAGLVAALVPLCRGRLAVAGTRRREWVISGLAPPVLRTRGRSIRFCVRFTEPMPRADRVLAWKNLIELNEALFLRTANRL